LVTFTGFISAKFAELVDFSKKYSPHWRAVGRSLDKHQKAVFPKHQET